MSILIEKAGSEKKAEFFHRNRWVIARLLGGPATDEAEKKPKRKRKTKAKAKPKAKAKAKPKATAKAKPKATAKAKPKATAKAKPKATAKATAKPKAKAKAKPTAKSKAKPKETPIVKKAPEIKAENSENENISTAVNSETSDVNNT